MHPFDVGDLLLADPWKRFLTWPHTETAMPATIRGSATVNGPDLRDASARLRSASSVAVLTGASRWLSLAWSSPLNCATRASSLAKSAAYSPMMRRVSPRRAGGRLYFSDAICAPDCIDGEIAQFLAAMNTVRCRPQNLLSHECLGWGVGVGLEATSFASRLRLLFQPYLVNCYLTSQKRGRDLPRSRRPMQAAKLATVSRCLFSSWQRRFPGAFRIDPFESKIARGCSVPGESRGLAFRFRNRFAPAGCVFHPGWDEVSHPVIPVVAVLLYPEPGREEGVA
ncbi:hypothetical protein Nham_3809 [Nitrobacter hamburgensis X14]|uniref:Uncharacterized protein n=1 Tax=Nitrobacter hamburgensis (strain DSM 10229 / NCIMB 13809 / X14) TaxID=323097 RepID=Q1QGX8_NITHX|nr:hypothetical protein Nham_3809 [Nitrobacter hamburgensis X14]